MEKFYKNKSHSFKLISILIAISLMLTSLNYYLFFYRNDSYANILDVPLKATLSPLKNPIKQKPLQEPILRGISIDKEKPFNFTFYFDSMDYKTINKKETNRLIEYFLGFLTMPQEKLWVNLSPLEKNRISPDSLSDLAIGKDMLLSDYLLKQVTTYSTNPSTEYGRNFWKKIKELAYKLTKSTDIPINIYYKVWIIPDKTYVYDYISKDNKKFIFTKDIKFKVLLEDDFLAYKNLRIKNTKSQILNKKAKEIFKQTILPIIQEQVNTSAYFSPLRQLFYSLILATYLKNNLRENYLYSNYIDQEKTKTLAISNSSLIKKNIYEAYLSFFTASDKYSLQIKEFNPYLQRTIKKHYFSGGILCPSNKIIGSFVIKLISSRI